MWDYFKEMRTERQWNTTLILLFITEIVSTFYPHFLSVTAFSLVKFVGTINPVKFQFLVSQ